MLDVNNVLPTLYKDRKMKILCSTTSTSTKNERRKTKDERRKNERRRSKKNRRKKKLVFKTNALVPKNSV